MTIFPESPSQPISISDLTAFCLTTLHRFGVSGRNAEITTDALVTTDAFGVFTHGTKLLAGYLRRLKAGGIRAEAQPRIINEGPAWAIMDGEAAPGQVIGVAAVETAIRKARVCGIAYVGVQNSNHFGAAGYYTLLAAKEKLIGLAMCNDTPSVAAPGSRAAITGTNPISYAIPAGDRDPIFFDAAMSTVAGGKVYAARLLGNAIPDDWLIGPDGKPTSNAALYPESASLAPVGGHKGYGLALLIEALSGILSGAGVMRQVGSWIAGDPSQPTHHGAAFLAIDPQTIAPAGDFESRVQMLMDEVHSSATADGVESVLLPGEREWANRRKALREGITLPRDVTVNLDEAARIAGFPIGYNEPKQAKGRENNL